MTNNRRPPRNSRASSAADNRVASEEPSNLRQTAAVRLASFAVYAVYLSVVIIVLFLIANFGFLSVRWVRDSVRDRRHPPAPVSRHAALYDSAEWDVDEHFSAKNSGYQFEAYTMWRRNPVTSRTTNVDQLGHRATWEDPALSLQDSSRLFEILVFGGSACWGSGAPDNGTIPSWIARGLSERGFHNVRVVNHGESGYCSTQELIDLVVQLQKGNRPGMVIFYDGLNDTAAAIQAGAAGAPFELDRMREVFNTAATHGRRAGWLESTRGYATTAVRSFFIEAPLVAWLRARVRPNQMGLLEADKSDVLAQQIIDTYVANLKAAQAIANEFGFEFFCYWQPSVHTKLQTRDEERYAVTASAREVGKVYLPATRLLKKMGPPVPGFHDVSEIFRDHVPTLFFDFAHLGPEGNRLVAEHIVQTIISSKSLGAPGGVGGLGGP